SGSLAAEREATVRAQLAGPILSTHADQGSRVATGTVLARIDDRTVRDQFLGARSGVTTAQSAADIAARELSRAEKLAEAGAIAERDLEAVRRANLAAQSQLDDAKARLTLAQKQLDDAQVRAPFAGVVSVRSVSAGDVVQPGGALFTVIDPRSMRLEANVPAAQLSAIRVGSPVTFSVTGYPGKTFQGKVTRINPAADPTTGQVRIVASIPNERNTLVAGLFAEGRAQSETREAPVVAANAVDVRGVRPWVLRLKGGRAEKVEVELGLKDEATEKYEVLKGVAAGDTLLVGAAQGITPGTPVRVSAPNDAAVTRN
ncbi:MAG TPA: efflux RND transporter periplasmic adaptor subunit, partial [Gemmatimonadaceae bacterium]|nr:efflux RND transporter periplasmic adaptor subunit [Gemmatimonadaceae bacterium]